MMQEMERMANNAKNKIKNLEAPPEQYNLQLRSGTINGAQAPLVGTDGLTPEFSIKQKKEADLQKNDLFKVPERKVAEKKEKTVI